MKTDLETYIEAKKRSMTYFIDHLKMKYFGKKVYSLREKKVVYINDFTIDDIIPIGMMEEFDIQLITDGGCFYGEGSAQKRGLNFDHRKFCEKQEEKYRNKE
jgi:hypothetical protein